MPMSFMRNVPLLGMFSHQPWNGRTGRDDVAFWGGLMVTQVPGSG
jgi:hypothetical protein